MRWRREMPCQTGGRRIKKNKGRGVTNEQPQLVRREFGTMPSSHTRSTQTSVEFTKPSSNRWGGWMQQHSKHISDILIVAGRQWDTGKTTLVCNSSSEQKNIPTGLYLLNDLAGKTSTGILFFSAYTSYEDISKENYFDIAQCPRTGSTNCTV